MRASTFLVTRRSFLPPRVRERQEPYCHSAGVALHNSSRLRAQLALQLRDASARDADAMHADNELSLPSDSYATKHPAAEISGDDITWARTRRGGGARARARAHTNSRTARNKPDERRIMHICVRTFQGRSFHLIGRQKADECSARRRRDTRSPSRPNTAAADRSRVSRH